ncbi:uncharacterized protein LOC120215621 [Hibiscus syriacus]|uniref:uncharacterized protein LOC120215621 n=1 Tax=Hibiscus syriacus TaxID=106335 RepID=UPI00192247CF|nr:uncharacterized protein LOC120215621 [Hibiscus syriacus]
MEDSEHGQYFSNLEQFRYRSVGDADEEEEELKNPQYAFFIDNLKRDEFGESYSVELAFNSDVSIVLRYEEKEGESLEDVDGQRNFMSNSKREKAKVPENSGCFSGKARGGTPKTTKKSLEIGDEEGKKSLGDVPGQKRKRVDEDELEEGAEADPVSCKSSEGSSKLMNVVVKVESQPEVPDSTHHKNDGSCPEVEVFTLDNMPLLEGDYMPFVPSKCFVGEECGNGIRDSSPSQFRENLMDLLKIPYNGKELDNLWREVTKRKPVQGVKELRHGRMKSYSTKTKGKSYLDWYKELNIKVEEFREDRRKVLYLLRGFFFWLKNTAHEGAFQPWMDSLYLKGFDRPEIV